jgi:hypothetical protein
MHDKPRVRIESLLVRFRGPFYCSGVLFAGPIVPSLQEKSDVVYNRECPGPDPQTDNRKPWHILCQVISARSTSGRLPRKTRAATLVVTLLANDASLAGCNTPRFQREAMSGWIPFRRANL